MISAAASAPASAWRSPVTAALALSLALGLCACGVPQEEFDAAVRERETLRKEITKLQAEQEKTLEQLLLDLENQTKLATEAAEEAAAARQAAEEANGALEALREEFEQYRSDYKLGHREAVRGTRLDALATVDGREFVSVTIRQVNPAGMEIFHDSGAAFLAFERLPEPIRDEFGYDPEEAAAFIRNEKAQEAEYAQHLETIEAEAEKAREERLERERPDPREVADQERGRIDNQLDSVDDSIATVKKEIERLEYLEWRSGIYGGSNNWKAKLEEKQEELRELEQKSLALRQSLDDLR